MVWAQVGVGIGSAIVGALTTELVEARRRQRDDARRDLAQIKADIEAARAATLVNAERFNALSRRITDVLDRLAADPPQTGDRPSARPS